MNKRKIVFAILTVLMLSVSIFIGVFFSNEITKMKNEYSQTSLPELRDVIKSYYSIMYSYFLYLIIVYDIVVKLDSFYLSKYQKIKNGKSISYWGTMLLKYIILFTLSRLVFYNPHLYSSLSLMVIFAYIALEHFLIKPYFVRDEDIHISQMNKKSRNE